MNWEELKGKIKGISFIGKTYDLVYGNRKVQKILSRRKEALHTIGYDLAEQIDQELSKQDVVFFMDFGNLLGITREGKFIGHDCDMDYGIFLSEKFTWKNLENAMNAIGLKKVGQYSIDNVILEQNYIKDELTIDFFSHVDDGLHSIAYLFFRKPEKKYSSIYERSVSELKMYRITATKKINVDGRIFTVPSEPEKYLESIYSQDWRTPNPDWADEDGPSWNEREDLTGYYERMK